MVMETFARLPDDTVVRIDPNAKSRWGHHGSMFNAIALAGTLYPFMAELFDDESVDFRRAGPERFSACVLAMRLVYERFSYVSKDIYRAFANSVNNGSGKFSVSYFGKRVCPAVSVAGMELWQLHLNYAAVVDMEALLLDSTFFEQEEPLVEPEEVFEATVEVDDLTPEVQESIGSTDVFIPDGVCCPKECTLCDVMSQDGFDNIVLSNVQSAYLCAKRNYVKPSKIRLLKGPDINYKSIVCMGSLFAVNPYVGSADNPRRIGLRTGTFHRAPRRLPPDRGNKGNALRSKPR
nr:MAG: hypothetical protein [Aspergillus flavus partitivirus 1]